MQNWFAQERKKEKCLESARISNKVKWAKRLLQNKKRIDCSKAKWKDKVPQLEVVLKQKN